MRRAVVATLLAIAGCGGGMAGPCPPDTECNVPPPSSLVLAAELVPAAQSGLVRQEVAALAWDDQGQATVQLVPRVQIQGLLLGDGDAPVPAQLVVTGTSLIPGRGDLTLQASTDSQGHFGFSLPKSSDAVYTVRVLPQPPADAKYPPASWTITADRDHLFPDADHGVVGNPLTFCMAGGSKLCPQTAAPLIAFSGRVWNALYQPLAGARVSAVDPTTSAPRSSTATTATDGSFQLALSPGVAPSDEIAVVVQPDPRLALPQLTRVVTAQDGHVELTVPALPAAAQFTIPVGGRSTSGADKTVPGARLDLSVDLSGSQQEQAAAYSVTVLTDDSGLATVDLIPGTVDVSRVYHVVVTPPADSIFARTELDLPVGPDAAMLPAIDLGLRNRVTGNLLAADGQPIKGAVVSAEPSVAPGELAPASAAIAPMTQTGGDGSFALRVDPGRYDLEIVPPAGAALPRWSLDNRDLTGSDLDLGPVPLPHAVLTHVVVIDPDGNPAPDVDVRVFALASPQGCASADCALPPRLRGEGTTAQGGVAPILLPAP